jgi:hypothetical protein
VYFILYTFIWYEVCTKLEKPVSVYCSLHGRYTERSTRYRTRHFFNNSNSNEDIATKFEQEYVRCVRNEEECVCSVCLIVATRSSSGKIIKEMPVSVANGKLCIILNVKYS